MIFVTVGTDRFEELVKAADEIAPSLQEKIIIQKGNSKYEVKNAESFNFTPNIKKYYNKARLIITHGGAGTTYALLKKHKKIIGVANLARTDTHQTEILEQFDKSGNLIWCRNPKDLMQCIIKANSFKFKKYSPPKCEIAKKISEFLNKN